VEQSKFARERGDGVESKKTQFGPKDRPLELANFAPQNVKKDDVDSLLNVGGGAK